MYLFGFTLDFLWISVRRGWKYEPQTTLLIFLLKQSNTHDFIFHSHLQKSETSFQSKNDNWAELYQWKVQITMWFLTTLWNFITVRKSFVKSLVYNLFYFSLFCIVKKQDPVFFGYQWIKCFLNTLTSLRRQFFSYLFFFL